MFKIVELRSLQKVTENKGACCARALILGLLSFNYVTPDSIDAIAGVIVCKRSTLPNSKTGNKSKGKDKNGVEKRWGNIPECVSVLCIVAH